MSFGGHVNDMVNRIKQNAALKNARKEKFKGGNDYSKTNNQKTKYNVPKLSPEKLEIFRLKVKQEAKQEKIKQLKFWGVFIIVLIMSFIIFNYV